MINFFEYSIKKDRENKRRLNIMFNVLKENGFNPKKHIDSDSDHYIFVPTLNKKTSFEGIRIYPIAETFAFRVQKMEKTEPYGKAYDLSVEDIFNDLMSENIGEEKAGKETAHIICTEIKDFFEKSVKAEELLANSEEESGIAFRTTSSEFSNLYFSK